MVSPYLVISQVFWHFHCRLSLTNFCPETNKSKELLDQVVFALGPALSGIFQSPSSRWPLVREGLWNQTHPISLCVDTTLISSTRPWRRTEISLDLFSFRPQHTSQFITTVRLWLLNYWQITLQGYSGLSFSEAPNPPVQDEKVVTEKKKDLK